MPDRSDITGVSYKKADNGKRMAYAALYRRFILLTLVCSAAPLLLVGWGIYTYYSNFATARLTENFQSLVENHRRLVEMFFKERVSDLQLTAFTHSLEALRDPENLRRVFETVNREQQYFTDIGVIGDQGKHFAYVGPYDLMDKDYSQTFWFKAVMEKGVYISDMFSGYRVVPHFIIAVLRREGDRTWILRATVFSDFLRSLVEDVKIGKTGEVYLINKDGIFQTSPRFSGKIMGSAPFSMDHFKDERGIRELVPEDKDPEMPHPRQIIGYAWLTEPRWMLAVKQNYDEAFRDVNHANRAILLFLHVSIIAILLVSVLITRHMIKIVKKRDDEEDRLNLQLLQASKLASVGELAAGVAHEINNPLSIILTENQVMRDIVEESKTAGPDLAGELIESIDQIDNQVQRCSHITQNLLRFSRRSQGRIELVDVNVCCEEVMDLLDKRAKTSGVQLIADFESGLPPVLADPFQLEQVFINLIANACDAHDGKPYGAIRISTRRDAKRDGVDVVFADTGSGIDEEHLRRIFDPFFTTKPVGKGTGLGLSISYSIVKSFGGDMSVRSEPGKGTEFTVFLPFKGSEDLREGHDDAKQGN